MSGKSRRDHRSQVDDNAHEEANVAIIRSMTPNGAPQPRHSERQPPQRRIAAGSGTTVQDVNQLINQFEQAKKMMKSIIGRKGRAKCAFLSGKAPRGILKELGISIYISPKAYEEEFPNVR